MATGNSDRPQYHLLPTDDPARAVQILRAAAGLDPHQPDPDDEQAE